MIILNDSELKLLRRRIIHAIYLAFGDRKDSEPKLIANLTYYLPTILNNVSLSSVSFKAAGIFIHQKPYVEFEMISNNKKAKVELGDLLLINNLVICGQRVKRVAMLLQAKKYCSKEPEKANFRPDNDKQFYLYSEWPEFKYASSGLKGKKRSISEDDKRYMHNGAKYLFINEITAIPHYLNDRTAIPTKPMKMKRPRSLYLELYDFILGKAGKEFSLPPDCDDIGWNRIIHDLITHITNVKLTKLKSVDGMQNHKQRGQGSMPSFTGKISDDANIKLSFDENSGERDVYGYDGSDGIGLEISVIEITTYVNSLRRD